ncbi:MAG: hypothetical protein IJ358_04350 [Clostridia bacterium]|nr:hypothetical protein [Clostridia bacterium]
MEKNNFNKAYVFIVGIFAIGIAISNIISFFNGVGFALVGASLLLILAITNILKDENNKKRFGDIFILITIELLLLIVLFFAYDFNLNGITNKFPLVLRNICSIYSILAVAYVLFRYISEVKGKKYNFVEYMLGNYTPTPKEKKAKPSKAEIKKNKELENGTLEPKPSSVENNVVGESIQVEETKEAEQIEVSNEDYEQEQTADTDAQSSETPAQDTNNSVNNNTNRTNFWY